MKRKKFIIASIILLPILAFALFQTVVYWHRYIRFQASGTLPIVYIQTEGNESVESKTDYLNATLYIKASSSHVDWALGSKYKPIGLKIKGRGNSTWTNYIKKPYRLKFKKRESLLGLKPCKHFALLAHADDSVGFLRNAIGFEVARQMNYQFTPSQVPCELYLNGRYQGLYFLTETIRVDKNRLNITPQNDRETDSDKIKTGWLIEFDNYSNGAHITSDEPSAYEFAVSYHTPEKLSKEQKAYLTQSIHDIISSIYQPDKKLFPLENYIDIQSLARFYVLSEAIGDTEAFVGSLFFHKDITDEKWVNGTVWDFGQALQTGIPTNKFIWEVEYFPTFIQELVKYPQFMEKVRAYWPVYYREIYPTLNQFIDAYATDIAKGAEADYARWPQYGNNNIFEKAELAKQILRERADFLQSQWGE